MMPPATQAARIAGGLSSAPATILGKRKIPTPITIPAVAAMASNSERVAFGAGWLISLENRV
jgi:hypothetical protein